MPLWPFAINWFISGWTPASIQVEAGEPNNGAPGSPCRLFISRNLVYRIDSEGNAAFELPGLGLMEPPSDLPLLPTNILCAIRSYDAVESMVISAPNMATAIAKAVDWMVMRFIKEIGGGEEAARYIEFVAAFDRNLADPAQASARLDQFIEAVTS